MRLASLRARQLETNSGTRATIQTSKQRRAGQRSSIPITEWSSAAAAPTVEWKFTAPVGTQTVVAEFTTADSVTIPHHLKTAELRTYMTMAPLKDLSEPDLSAPAARRKRQIVSDILVEAVARLGTAERRAIARGQDIYATTAPIVVEATQRIINLQEVRGLASSLLVKSLTRGTF